MANGDKVLGQFTQSFEEEKKASGRRLKVGIIGTGWIAEAHIESYKQMDDVDIVAAADLIPGKAEAFMKRYGVEGVHFYPSHKEMIDNEQLDAVSICTYNTQHAVPTIYNFRESVLAGGLMSYGANLPNNYRQLGAYAGRILKGESPADLPVMLPAIFDFAINLVTAKALNLTLPPMLVARADELVPLPVRQA